jgi:hypothetical protein
VLLEMPSITQGVVGHLKGTTASACLVARHVAQPLEQLPYLRN